MLDRRRAAQRAADDDEAGFTLVETIVALCLVTIAMFALTAELTAYLHHQANERARTTAVRKMTTAIENARRLDVGTLRLLAGSAWTTPPDYDKGKPYTITTVVQRCSLSDANGSCSTPASSAVEDMRVRVTVAWQDGTATKSVSSTTSVADDSTGQYSPTGSGTLSTLVGGTAQEATSVTVSAFTASPTTTTVDSSGHPTSAIALSLTTVGLTAATTSIPVTWSDDSGSHQWSLTGGPSTWTASVPTSSITKAVSSGTSSLTFAATVPGTSALPTATVTLSPAVTVSSCTVSPNPIVLTAITRKTVFAETLTCTVSGLAATDSVSVSYQSASSSANAALTSADGTTWTKVLPAGTSMASGLALTETFTFTATRSSDGVTATRAVTAVLA